MSIGNKEGGCGGIGPGPFTGGGAAPAPGPDLVSTGDDIEASRLLESAGDGIVEMAASPLKFVVAVSTAFAAGGGAAVEYSTDQYFQVEADETLPAGIPCEASFSPHGRAKQSTTGSFSSVTTITAAANAGDLVWCTWQRRVPMDA